MVIKQQLVIKEAWIFVVTSALAKHFKTFVLNSFYYAIVTSFINFRISLTLDMDTTLPYLMTELLLLVASPPSRNARWLRWKRFAWKRAEALRICRSCRGRCQAVLCSPWINSSGQGNEEMKRKRFTLLMDFCFRVFHINIYICI